MRHGAIVSTKNVEGKSCVDMCGPERRRAVRQVLDHMALSKRLLAQRLPNLPVDLLTRLQAQVRSACSLAISAVVIYRRAGWAPPDALFIQGVGARGA